MKEQKRNYEFTKIQKLRILITFMGTLFLFTLLLGKKLTSLKEVPKETIPIIEDSVDAPLIREESVQEEIFGKYIRVLLKSQDYKSIYHKNIIVSSDSDYIVYRKQDDRIEKYQLGAGQKLTLSQNDFNKNTEKIMIKPQEESNKILICNLQREQGTPQYSGMMELFWEEQGLILVNEVSVEEYLRTVVPSEMPATYPMEALKAQAICARTYAYNHMFKTAYPQYEAHVDDSTSFQVYNNCQEQMASTEAVCETSDMVLFTDDNHCAATFFYSTSCGVGSDTAIWKNENAVIHDYIQERKINRNEGVYCDEMEALGTVSACLREEEGFEVFILSRNEEDYEYEEPWYRWSYTVKKMNKETILKRLKEKYSANSKLVLTQKGSSYISAPIQQIGNIKNIKINKRGAGGVADELIIEGTKKTYKVISENFIRYVLNDGASKVVRQDGSKVSMLELLPSGFFMITTGKEDGLVIGYTLIGGGFGHGVGMSQNAAKHMASDGLTAEEILHYFYKNCDLRRIR